MSVFRQSVCQHRPVLYLRGIATHAINQTYCMSAGKALSFKLNKPRLSEPTRLILFCNKQRTILVRFLMPLSFLSFPFGFFPFFASLLPSCPLSGVFYVLYVCTTDVLSLILSRCKWYGMECHCSFKYRSLLRTGTAAVYVLVCLLSSIETFLVSCFCDHGVGYVSGKWAIHWY